MLENWKQWEGQVVDAKFPLRAFLGGSSRSAVYLIDSAAAPGAESGKAAIKLIPADPRDAETQLDRWNRAMGLSHPHLIRLLDAGRCELDSVPLLYAVMEFADENLAEILPQRSLTAEETADALGPVLEALAYLHEQGFAHAAIKPSNIMAVGNQLKISSDGVVPIGEQIGATPVPTAYDPPEIARGVISPPQTMSPAGDVWSLGMTLVEVLTQSIPPHPWGSPQDPPLPDGLPQPFLDIARHCLRREARRRWTIAQIAERMSQPAGPALPGAPDARDVPEMPRETRQPASANTAAASRKSRKSGRYGLLVTAAALLAAIFLVPRLMHHDAAEVAPETASQPAPSSAPSPSAEPVPPAPTTTTPKPPAPAGAVASAPSASAAAPAARSEPNANSQGDARAVLKRVLPQASASALDTVQGTIRVVIRLTVDASGNVTGSTFDYRGPSGYFADKAMDAARQWKFAAGDAPSELLLRFAITRVSTDVVVDTADR